MSASTAIQAAKAFVELALKDSAFVAGLGRSQRRLEAFAKQVRSVNSSIAGIALAVGVPAAAGTKQFADFEQAIADLRSVANPTAKELAQIKQAALDLSKATGQGPMEVVASFTELLRAGRSVKDVLGGAGEAAVKFARVGALPAADAAVVLSDAMNIFRAEGIIAARAADILSAAADASSTSIQGIVEAFSNSATDFRRGNQSFTDLTAAIALMANEGQKGGEAGTRLRVFMNRLQAPTDQAKAVFQQLGLNVRDAAGNMLPLGQIIDRLNDSIKGMNQEQVDNIFEKIFGERASQGANVLLMLGSQGLNKMKQEMNGSLTVGSKFALMMDTLKGKLTEAWSAIQRLAIAFGDHLAGPMTSIVGTVARVVEGFTSWIEKSPRAAIAIATLATAIIGVATAGIVLLPIVSMLSTILMALSTPIGAAVTGVTVLAGLIVTTAAVITLTWMGMTKSGRAFAADIKAIFGDVVEAISHGKIDEAMELLSLKFEVGLKRVRIAAAKQMVQLRGLLGLADANDFANLAAQGIDIAKLDARIAALRKTIRDATDPKLDTVMGLDPARSLKSVTHLEERYNMRAKSLSALGTASAGSFNPYAISALGRGGVGVQQLLAVARDQLAALQDMGQNIAAIRSGQLAIRAA